MEQFRLNSNGKIFSVVDVSSVGFSLKVIDREDLIYFTVGAKVEGTLSLFREKYPVLATVKRTGDRIGLEFTELPDAVAAALIHKLDPKNLGQTLKAMPTTQNGILWYQGVSDTQAVFWKTPEGKFQKFGIFCLGQYVFWEELTGISTGLSSAIVDENTLGQPRGITGLTGFDSREMFVDHAVDPSKLKIAKALIMSSNLSEELKSWCSRRLAP